MIRAALLVLATLLLATPLVAAAEFVPALRAVQLDNVGVAICDASDDPHDPGSPSRRCQGAYVIPDDRKVCTFEEDEGYKDHRCYGTPV